MLDPIACATVAELRRELRIPASDTSQDATLEDVLARIADQMEGECSCRLMYRGTIESMTYVVGNAAWANGSVPFLQLTGARSLVFTASAGVTGGIVSVAGFTPALENIVVSYDAALTKHFESARVFDIAGITSVTVSGATGSGTFSIGIARPWSEYHSMRDTRSHFYTLSRPIIDLAYVNEDTQRLYLATTNVPRTDYVASRMEGRIQRSAPAGGMGAPWVDFPEDEMFRHPERFRAWSSVPQAVKLSYSGGFEPDPLRISVPRGLKDINLQGAAILYRTIEGKYQGVSSKSETLGSTTRYSKVALTEELKEQLKKYHTRSTTGEVSE